MGLHHIVGKTTIETPTDGSMVIYPFTDGEGNINTKMFTVDATYTLQFDNFNKLNAKEILLTKGKPETIGQGSWAFINDNGYLKIILHDQNNINFLVYKTDSPICKTKIRKVWDFIWSETNKLEKMYLDSLEIPFSLDTSLPHYHTSVNNFTGIRQNNILFPDNGYYLLELGSKKTSFPFANVSIDQSLVSLYYSQYKLIKKTPQEINALYQQIRDTRVIPSNGKILFATDQGDNIYSLYSMDADGDDRTLILSDSVDIINPIFNKVAGDYESFTFGRSSGEDYIKLPNLPAFRLSSGTDDAQTLGANFNKDNTEVYFSTFNASIYRIGNFNIANNSTTFIDVIAGRNEGVLYASNTDVNKILLAFSSAYSNPAFLVIFNKDTQTYQTIFTNTFGNNAVPNKRDIEDCKFSFDDSKIGFSLSVLASDSEKTAVIMNSDGTNPMFLEYATRFCAFISNTKILYSKLINSKWQLHTRDLITNEIKNISNNNYNDFNADFKA